MKVKLYAIGFSAVIIGFLSTYKVQAQQLLSLVKTEAYNNHLYGGFYSGDQNVMVTEQIYTYNDKNLLLDLSTWQTAKGERNLTSQSGYIYNEDGNTLSVITKQRDHATKKMNIQGMTEYEYNTEGKIESMVYQYRDYASGELVYSYKYDYIYGAGENQEMKIYNWSAAENNWITEPPYDEMEYSEEAIVSEYEGGLGYEHPGNKYELVYNEDKTVSTGTYQNFHKRLNKWYYTSRTVSQLNPLGFTVKQVNDSWNVHCEDWVPSYMSTFKYNDNNVSIQNEYHSWDPIAHEWVLHSRTTSTYIDPKPIVEVEEKSASWNLFPNPSDGDVFIELEEPRNADARVVVMNKLGQPVFADIITARQTELVLDLELLPNGNYIVRVDDGTDVSSKQVVIQQ